MYMYKTKLIYKKVKACILDILKLFIKGKDVCYKVKQSLYFIYNVDSKKIAYKL